MAIGETRGPEQRFVFVNPYFERMVHRQNLIGKTVAEVFPHLLGSPLMALLDSIYRSGEAVAVSELETPFDRHDDGDNEPAFFSFNIEPLRDEAGAVAGVMGVAVEVTEQVLARRRVEAALNGRDDFISVAAHELRGPMTALRLQIEAILLGLKGSMPVDRALPKLSQARRQLDRLDALVADLVDVTRISSGRLELKREAVELGQLCEEILQRFSDELAKAGCRVAVECERGLVGQWDRFRLDQVITNLLTNAMKYGAGRPIHLRVRRDGDHAVLTVRDEGVGIPEAEQARIFERFERASSGLGQKGLGLGLWIVRTLVTALGGTIGVASDPGQGARFTLRLHLQTV